MTANASRETISNDTLASSMTLGGSAAVSSESSTWKALHLKVVTWCPVLENLEYLPASDPLVILAIGRGGQIECAQSRRWRSKHYYDGTGTVLSAGDAGRVRWNLSSDRLLTLAYTYIPQSTVDRVMQELSETGSPHARRLETHFYSDKPAVSSAVRTLLPALRMEQGEFLAQATANWLAVQLLVSQQTSGSSSAGREGPSDVRLTRVLEYMEANADKPLSLPTLAKQAGVSRYHFIKLFRQAIGTTPHQHLLSLRLRIATSMLREADRSILEISLACGFNNPSHFASAFRQVYHVSPTDFRYRERVN